MSYTGQVWFCHYIHLSKAFKWYTPRTVTPRTGTFCDFLLEYRIIIVPMGEFMVYSCNQRLLVSLLKVVNSQNTLIENFL